MNRCPNCSFALVLLERRRKFKCSKCRRLFSQKFIEDREFKEWNKRKREEDKDRYEYERKVLEVKRRKKYGDLRDKQKKLAEYRTLYYWRHRNEILAYKKQYRQTAKERNNEYKRMYRAKNQDRVRLWSRIAYWRQKQKRLAVQTFENDTLEALNRLFKHSLPT